MIEIRWDWIAEHLDDVAEKSWQHLQLLVIPMLAGFVIALRAGARWRCAGRARSGP